MGLGRVGRGGIGLEGVGGEMGRRELDWVGMNGKQLGWNEMRRGKVEWGGWNSGLEALKVWGE